jgi:hypothetical protein
MGARWPGKTTASVRVTLAWAGRYHGACNAGRLTAATWAAPAGSAYRRKPHSDVGDRRRLLSAAVSPVAVGMRRLTVTSRTQRVASAGCRSRIGRILRVVCGFPRQRCIAHDGGKAQSPDWRRTARYGGPRLARPGARNPQKCRLLLDRRYKLEADRALRIRD